MFPSRQLTEPVRAVGLVDVRHDPEVNLSAVELVDVPDWEIFLIRFDNATKDVYATDVHLEVALRKVSVREARENLKALIDQATAGEEIILLRRGREVARLVPPKGSRRKLPSLETFRASIQPQDKPLSSEVISGREKERY